MEFEDENHWWFKRNKGNAGSRSPRRVVLHPLGEVIVMSSSELYILDIYRIAVYGSTFYLVTKTYQIRSRQPFFFSLTFGFDCEWWEFETRWNEIAPKS